MAEVNTAELEAKVDAAFGAGFSDTPPVIPAKVVEKPEPAKPVTAAPVPVPEKPEYIRVTKKDWENTKARLGNISVLESQVAKLTGSMPKADAIIQQAVERFQSQTPAGVTVEISDEDFAEMAADFPELAKTTRAAFEKVFKKANVRGTGTPAAMDPDAINKAVDARLKARDDAAVAATREKEMTGLAETYPDWGKIVGQPIAMGTTTPVETPWRKWATTHDQAALSTDSPAEVKASIAKFMASQKPATPAPDRGAARRAVIADAVTPRAEGGTPPIAQRETAEDAFGKAFKAAKRS